MRAISQLCLGATLALFLICDPSAFSAEPTPTDATAQRALSLYTEKIPHLELKEATLQEAIRSLQESWQKNHPGETFPVGITQYRPPAPAVPSEPPPPPPRPSLITLDLRNIPFADALSYIAVLTNQYLHFRDGVFQFEQMDEIDEGWKAGWFDLTPGALAELKLDRHSTEAETRRAFERFGVKLESWMRLQIIDRNRTPITNSDDTKIAEGCSLVTLTYTEQRDQIAGILFLLGNGFKITK